MYSRHKVTGPRDGRRHLSDGVTEVPRAGRIAPGCSDITLSLPGWILLLLLLRIEFEVSRQTVGRLVMARSEEDGGREEDGGGQGNASIGVEQST